jgi:hypothetical protein
LDLVSLPAGLLGYVLSLPVEDFDFEDELSLSDVLAFDFEISVTLEHWPAFAMAQPLSAEVAEDVALDVLAPEPWLQVSITRSPALTSLSFEAALLSTMRVTLSWLSAAVLLAWALPGFLTVIVLAVASVETTTALIFADFDDEDEVEAVDLVSELVEEVVDCDVRCLASMSVSVDEEVLDELSRCGVTVL